MCQIFMILGGRKMQVNLVILFDNEIISVFNSFYSCLKRLLKWTILII